MSVIYKMRRLSIAAFAALAALDEEYKRFLYPQTYVVGMESGLARVRDELVRTSTMLLTWSLEDSVERADSMRARGWESGIARTQYRSERLRSRDIAALVGIAVLLALCTACAWTACSSWRFYPRMEGLGFWGLYVPFVLLVSLPAAVAIGARVSSFVASGGNDERA